MPSLADARHRIERALRVIALVVLAAWIANALRPLGSRTEMSSGGDLRARLAAWTRTPVDSVHVRLDTVPDATSKAWLAALRGAGAAVTWSGATLSAIAVEVYPSPEPAGGTVLLAASGSRAVVSDALGPIDTLPAGEAAAATRLASIEGTVSLVSDRQPARVSPIDAPTATKHIFVAGSAGWEAKFVIAALEEHGWTVDAHLLVAPGQDVYQGSRAPLDTSRHAAVVLVDSTAAELTAGVERFARQGGGVVIAGDANRARSVARLIVWHAGRRQAAPLGVMPGDTSWRGLSRIPLDSAGARAVALEERDGRGAVLARRYFGGRVIGVGYDQTWRWRMGGGDAGAVAHRDWWSRMVGSVAMRSTSASMGSAPLASLYDVLGPPTRTPRATPVAFSRDTLSALLGAICLAALLAEWLLRRARGAR